MRRSSRCMVDWVPTCKVWSRSVASWGRPMYPIRVGWSVLS
jgi:hypothetical protein